MRLIFTLMHFSFHFLISRHKSTHHCPVLLLLQVAKLLLWYSPWCYICNPLTRHAHCSGSHACEPETRRDQNSWAQTDPQTSLKDPPPVSLHQNHNPNDIIGSQSQPKAKTNIRLRRSEWQWKWQAYHTAHLEAIKGFGMHGYEIDFEVLVQEYQVFIISVFY